MKHVNEEGYNENPTLSEVLKSENDLKNILVQYVGEKFNPEDNKVTVEMVVEIMAAEFPEFLLVIAEENFIRGYQQALDDVEAGRNMMEKENEEQENNKLHKVEKEEAF